MTFAEFRAWFDGYCEHVGEAPTPEQWARIKAKLGEVAATPSIGPPVWQPPTQLGEWTLRGCCPATTGDPIINSHGCSCSLPNTTAIGGHII